MTLIDINYDNRDEILNLDNVEIEKGISVCDYNIVKTSLIVNDSTTFFSGQQSHVIEELFEHRGFAVAPASTMLSRHACFYGGLIDHSLTVYDVSKEYIQNKDELSIYTAKEMNKPDSYNAFSEQMRTDLDNASYFASRTNNGQNIRSLYKGSDKNWESEKDIILEQATEKNRIWARESSELPKYWQDALNAVDKGKVSIDKAISTLKKYETEDGYALLEKSEEQQLRHLAKSRNDWKNSFKLSKNGTDVMNALSDQELRFERISKDSDALDAFDTLYAEKENLNDKIRSLDAKSRSIYRTIDEFSLLDTDNILNIMEKKRKDVTQKDVTKGIEKLQAAGLIEEHKIKPSEVAEEYAVAGLFHDLCKSAVRLDGEYVDYYLIKTDRHGNVSEKKPFTMNPILKKDMRMYDNTEHMWDGTEKGDFRSMKHGSLSVMILDDIVGKAAEPLHFAIDSHMGPSDARWNREIVDKMLTTNPEAAICYLSDRAAERRLDNITDTALKESDYDTIIENVKADPMFSRVMDVLHSMKEEGREIKVGEIMNYL